MPIYEFQCEQCGERFDQLMGMSDPAPACPSCSGREVRKLVSAAGFVLKGGGWYKDHYGLKKGSSSSDSKSDGKTESPATETKAEPKKTEKASVAA
jgi:putative FmdB family regulatory protein